MRAYCVRIEPKWQRTSYRLRACVCAFVIQRAELHACVRVCVRAYESVVRAYVCVCTCTRVRAYACARVRDCLRAGACTGACIITYVRVGVRARAGTCGLVYGGTDLRVRERVRVRT